MSYTVKHNISLTVLLFALWFGLSGLFDVLMLSLGIASTLLVVYFSYRMDTIDRQKHPARLTLQLLRFWLFLSREVISANIDVVRRIFRPGKNISPQLFQLPMTKKTDLARVIYANSITLTPGTVCVKVNRKAITVHSLSKESADDLRSGRMADAVPEDERDEET
ncbi:MAG: Na+/H+ antiporter subunit E [Gammaproteobacteria bacterium]|nr:Na+/H+ antiporter subunit E [Gammaproteobacteria bacterium]NNJ49563.1 Na+/H+ antiporter subunit E [Gammaproteobacteria bacterium]